MWTVTVTLLDGSEEKYRDKDRKGPRPGTQAYGYRFEVDDFDGLHVLRELREHHYGTWQAIGTEKECAYYKPARWERVRST